MTKKEWVIDSEKKKPVLPVSAVEGMDTIVYTITVAVAVFLWFFGVVF
jgi:hypothetical protein